MPDEKKPDIKSLYKVGDRVQILNSDANRSLNGTYGTVAAVAKHGVLVNHDRFHQILHDGGGETPQGHGWWYDADYIEFYLKKIGSISIKSDLDIAEIM